MKPTSNRFNVVHVCGMNGDPVNREPSRKFWRVWSVFSKLRQADKDLYAVKQTL